jgi:hypothetical protein
MPTRKRVMLKRCFPKNAKKPPMSMQTPPHRYQYSERKFKRALFSYTEQFLALLFQVEHVLV